MKEKKGIVKTTKKFNELGFKGFMKKWGEGIDGVTPLQTAKISLWSFIPMLIGICYGIVVTFIGKTYWVVIILCASLPITLIQVFSTYQRYRKFKQVENTLKLLNEQNLSNIKNG